VLNINFC